MSTINFMVDAWQRFVRALMLISLRRLRFGLRCGPALVFIAMILTLVVRIWVSALIISRG